MQVDIADEVRKLMHEVLGDHPRDNRRHPPDLALDERPVAPHRAAARLGAAVQGRLRHGRQQHGRTNRSGPGDPDLDRPGGRPQPRRGHRRADALRRRARGSRPRWARRASRWRRCAARSSWPACAALPRVIREIHSLLQDVDAGSSTFTAGTASLCTRAFAVLRGYLSELQRGEPEQPLKLASIHQEMLAARGVQRLAELDLFYLDCSSLPPEPNVAVAPEAAVAAAREQRARYQQGMLAWLRGDASGLARMREAIGRVDASQASAARAPAVVDRGGISRSAGRAEHAAHQRYEARLRRHRSATAPQRGRHDPRLPRICCARCSTSCRSAQPVTERIAQIKQLYGLDSVMPGLRGGLDMIDVQVVEELRGKARLLKSLWEKAVSGAEPGDPAPFGELIGQLSQRGRAVRAARRADRHAARHRGGLAREPACGGQRDRHRDGHRAAAPREHAGVLARERPAARAARRGGRRAAGRSRSAAKPTPLRHSVSLQSEALREGDAKAIRAEVAAQVLASLSAAQTALEARFTDAGPQDLAPARKTLRQVRGALVVLDQQQAAVVAQSAAMRRSARCRKAASPPTSEQQELACVLSALYVFVERLGVGSAEFEEIMQRAQVAPRWYGDAATDAPGDAGGQRRRMTPAPVGAAGPGERAGGRARRSRAARHLPRRSRRGAGDHRPEPRAPAPASGRCRRARHDPPQLPHAQGQRPDGQPDPPGRSGVVTSSAC